MFFRNSGQLPVYDPSRPLEASIQACPYRWIAAKCSRTITIGGISYTANRGSPPCSGDFNLNEDNDPANQQTAPTGFRTMPRTKATGTFRIRIYGKVCEDRPGGTGCRLFRPDGIDNAGSGFTCVRALHRHLCAGTRLRPARVADRPDEDRLHERRHALSALRPVVRLHGDGTMKDCLPAAGPAGTVFPDNS